MKKTLLAILLVVSMLALVACGGSGAKYNDGTYTGSANGFNSETPIEVEVVVKEGKISEVNITKHEESVDDVAAVGDALEQVPQAIVKNNSTDIDGVSGATYTSTGIKDAVNAALETAK